jgi:hypothetical protein
VLAADFFPVDSVTLLRLSVLFVLDVESGSVRVLTVKLAESVRMSPNRSGWSTFLPAGQWRSAGSQEDVAVTLSRRAATPLLAVAALLPLTLATPAAAVPGCPATPSFTSSIPAPVGPPAAYPVPDANVVTYAAIGADAKAYVADTDISGDPLQVGPLGCYDGAAVDNPAVMATLDETVLLVRSTNGRVYERRITASGATEWTSIPNGFTNAGPAAVITPDGTRHLFVRGTNNKLYYANRGADAAAWSTWANLGGTLYSGPTVTLRPSGGLAVFVRGAGNKIYGNYGGGTLGSGWTGFQQVPGGGATSSNVAATFGFATNRLDLFVAGTRGGLYQQTYAAGHWRSSWFRVDPALPATGRLAAAALPSRMIVYAAAEGDTAYKQYAGGWLPFNLAPYTCDQCLPTTLQASSSPRRAAARTAAPSWPAG